MLPGDPFDARISVYLLKQGLSSFLCQGDLNSITQSTVKMRKRKNFCLYAASVNALDFITFNSLQIDFGHEW